MPEINRGIAVAYCDPPGPLEPVPGRDVHRGLADAEGLDGGAGRLVLPRVQPAHGAQPDGARGDAGPLPAAAALAPVHRGDQAAGGAVVGAVRRGLGGLRRGADGRPRVPGGGRPGGASACSSSRCSCAWSSTRSSTPGCTRHGMTEAEAMTLMTGARLPGGRRGVGQVAPRAAHLGAAVDLLRRLHRGRGPGRRPAAARACPSAPPTTACSPTARRLPACSANALGACTEPQQRAPRSRRPPSRGRPARAAARRGTPVPAGWG